MNTVEQRVAQFEAMNATSRVVIHVKEGVSMASGKPVMILQGKGDHTGETYELGYKSFELMQHVVRHPVGNKELGVLLKKSEQTIKNQLTDLFVLFGVRGRVGEREHRIGLILRLLDLGILEYPLSYSIMEPGAQSIAAE